jgi:hypothetical protein
MFSPLLAFLYDVVSQFVPVPVTLADRNDDAGREEQPGNEYEGEQTGEMYSVALHGSSPQAKA